MSGRGGRLTRGGAVLAVELGVDCLAGAVDERVVVVRDGCDRSYGQVRRPPWTRAGRCAAFPYKGGPQGMPPVWSRRATAAPCRRRRPIPCGLVPVIRSISAPSTVAVSGIRRSHSGQPQQLAVSGREQTACRLPPCTPARRAALTRTPSPAESMKVTRLRSTISGCPLFCQPEQAFLQSGHCGHVDITGDLRNHNAAFAADHDRQLTTHGHPPAAHRHTRPSR